MVWGGGSERRKSVRAQLRMTVHVELEGQPRFYEAVSRDLSLDGACLVIRRKLEHCTPIYLEFCLPGSLNALYCPAHVVWSSELASAKEPSYLMGVEFVRPPRATRRELKRFLAERRRLGRKGIQS